MAKITADFTKITGKIKPMHGVGQPPITGLTNEMFHYLKEAGIPYARLHDVGGMFGGGCFVDIPNLFPDFDADVKDPASYTFEFTDKLIEGLMENGCEPFFRLGITIENYVDVRAYRVDPPKDFDKWARICEQVIRHYNEGWANGYNYDIKYWEIWNEPEGKAMWNAPFSEYCRLYDITSKHLKECFGDKIKVGGYASCGFYALDKDLEMTGIGLDPSNTMERYIQNFYTFMEYVSEHKCPLDFFSWHSYSAVHDVKRYASYCHSVLEKFGYGNIEEIINEWNPCHTIKNKRGGWAAAQNLAMMLGMQKSSVTMMHYYDAQISYSIFSGMFNPDLGIPYPNYYGFMSFNSLYKLKDEVFTETDDENLFIAGATNGKKKVLVMSNINNKEITAEFDITGADVSDVDIFMINDEYTYTLTGKEIVDGKLVIPANTCVEIKFYN